MMGMYTEIYVNVDFKDDTPDEVIDTIRAICNCDYNSPRLADKPSRWSSLFQNGSYYHTLTSVGLLTFDKIGNHWSLLGKGDIKNYDCEIEKFFDFIKPWCDNSFIGYLRYEEYREPTLVYSDKDC